MGDEGRLQAVLGSGAVDYFEAMELGLSSGSWREPKLTGKLHIETSSPYNPVSHACDAPAAVVRPSFEDLPRGRKVLKIGADEYQPDPITFRPHCLRPQHLIEADVRAARPRRFHGLE